MIANTQLRETTAFQLSAKHSICFSSIERATHLGLGLGSLFQLLLLLGAISLSLITPGHCVVQYLCLIYVLPFVESAAAAVTLGFVAAILTLVFQKIGGPSFNRIPRWTHSTHE